VDKMMTFITEVQNIVNDTSIPRPIRNKLFNDMQSDIGLEINPQQIYNNKIFTFDILDDIIFTTWHFIV
jgi:uncharacterized protein (UPF0147 family)